MAKKSATEVPADKLDLYEKLVATNPDIERKGKTMPYTSLNGHMFSFLTIEGSWAFDCGVVQLLPSAFDVEDDTAHCVGTGERAVDVGSVVERGGAGSVERCVDDDKA